MNLATHSAIDDHPRRLSKLFRVLLNCGFFGPVLPPLQKLVTQTRMPKRMIEDAISLLAAEGVVSLDPNGQYHRVYPAMAAGAGAVGTLTTLRTRVGVLTERNIFMRYFEIYQDYLIGLSEVFGADSIDIVFSHELVDEETKVMALDELIRAGVRGLVVLGKAESPFRAALAATEVPVVLCGNSTIEQRDFACVCSDNIFGMKNLVRHLFTQGHRRIAYYTTAAHAHDGYRHRIIGYRNAMEEAGLNAYEDFIQEDRHSPDSANTAAEIFMGLRVHKQGPTAFVCGCDREAFELISELEKRGIQVPVDVSVAGFENSLINVLSPIPLTTVDIFARDMGRMAGELLLWKMKVMQPPARVVMSSLLLERASVAPIPAE